MNLKHDNEFAKQNGCSTHFFSHIESKKQWRDSVMKLNILLIILILDHYLEVFIR